MSTPSALFVGRTRDGYRVRVEGRGTLRESPAVHAFALRALGGGAGSLVIDLSTCDYLDSTFLGSMVDLHKRFGCGNPPRFVVNILPAKSERLLAPTRLDKLLKRIEASPDVLGEEVRIIPETLSAGDLGRHVMECHRRLAELDGPNRAAFEQIADRLAQDLVGDRSDRS